MAAKRKGGLINKNQRSQLEAIGYMDPPKKKAAAKKKKKAKATKKKMKKRGY